MTSCLELLVQGGVFGHQSGQVFFMLFQFTLRYLALGDRPTRRLGDWPTQWPHEFHRGCDQSSSRIIWIMLRSQRKGFAVFWRVELLVKKTELWLGKIIRGTPVECTAGCGLASERHCPSDNRAVQLLVPTNRPIPSRHTRHACGTRENSRRQSQKDIQGTRLAASSTRPIRDG